jgi:hypothetical protein
MLTRNELKRIFENKRQKSSRTVDRKGSLKEKTTPGFVTTDFETFSAWFNQEQFDRGCHYCHTTNERSNELFLQQRNGERLDATRGGKRGRRLELDRKNPNQPYDNLENLVWCCYWCNNAKSNFFTEEEFKPIAEAIGKVLRKL